MSWDPKHDDGDHHWYHKKIRDSLGQWSDTRCDRCGKRLVKIESFGGNMWKQIENGLAIYEEAERQFEASKK